MLQAQEGRSGLQAQAVLGTRRGRWVRTPWRHSSQTTGLSQSPSVPAGCQGSGDWRGPPRASWLGQAGRKMVSLCPTAPLPHPSSTSLIRVPAMLENTPGPPFTWVLAHPVPIGPDHPCPQCQSPGIAKGPAGFFKVLLGRRAMRLRPRATPRERETEELEREGRKVGRSQPCFGLWGRVRGYRWTLSLENRGRLSTNKARSEGRSGEGA